MGRNRTVAKGMRAYSLGIGKELKEAAEAKKAAELEAKKKAEAEKPSEVK